MTTSINVAEHSTMETLLTYIAVPFGSDMLLKCGITGKDLHKRERPVLPEATGLIAGIVLCLFLPRSSILLCTLAGLWIGALDDTIDLQWRYKLLLSAVAYVPLYQNLTTVLLFGNLIYLGPLYHVYMLLWCIWCGNAINIYAGINGIEVGQCLIIAIGLLWVVDDTRTIISFIGVCVALLWYNFYPAKVFVGDSWCYMSGMFFVAVAQHETESLAIMMLPQIINTLQSLPELTGYCECPRHRMPKYDENQDKLVTSGHVTLINVILRIYGPMHEKTLCIVLLVIQSVFVFLACVLKFQY